MRFVRLDLFNEKTHVGEDGIAAGATHLGVDRGPELRTGQPQLGQDGVLLHGLRGQGAVKVVDDGQRAAVVRLFSWHEVQAGCRTRS